MVCSDVHLREPAAEAPDDRVAEVQQPVQDAAGAHDGREHLLRAGRARASGASGYRRDDLDRGDRECRGAGRLTKKMIRQSANSVRRPSTRTPIAAPRRRLLPKRRAPSPVPWKQTMMMASAAGEHRGTKTLAGARREQGRGLPAIAERTGSRENSEARQEKARRLSRSAARPPKSRRLRRSVSSA